MSTTALRAQPHHRSELGALVEAYYTFDGIAFDAASIHRGLAALIDDPALGGAWTCADRTLPFHPRSATRNERTERQSSSLRMTSTSA